MKLNSKELHDRIKWEEAGFILPKFNIKEVKENTKKRPEWVHFGCGNIFRAFLGNVWQELLDAGQVDTGIVAAEGFDYEIIEKMNKPHDDLSLLVTLRSDGTIEKKVIASIVESIKADSQDEGEFVRLKEVFRNPSLKMASFTITEKGYQLKNPAGAYYPDVLSDFENGPEACKSYIGKVASLCYVRYQADALPLAMVSMDNCSHNGTRLYEAVVDFARHWSENGKTDARFLDYIENRQKVSFPWSMIDKITPRPDDSVKSMLLESGFEDVRSVVTKKNTYVAPFVNAEEAQYLVIEDAFPAGRPPLEQAGILFTDRETVDKVEKMKVCTCLNPLHTALAVFGCLLSYTEIYKEMEDPQLKKLVEIIGYKEGLPVVVDPGIIDPKAFIDEVLNVRIPNPFMPDTPQRIATDTSQKLPIRFGETIKAYATREDLNVSDLKLIPLVLAGWCRYLMGVDDQGREFQVSPDPRYEELKGHIEHLQLGEPEDISMLEPILSDAGIFGVDLYQAGLGKTVEGYFKELCAGVGAVRETLIKYTV